LTSIAVVAGIGVALAILLLAQGASEPAAFSVTDGRLLNDALALLWKRGRTGAVLEVEFGRGPVISATKRLDVPRRVVVEISMDRGEIASVGRENARAGRVTVECPTVPVTSVELENLVSECRLAIERFADQLGVAGRDRTARMKGVLFVNAPRLTSYSD
jgi:hypothetical protein